MDGSTKPRVDAALKALVATGLFDKVTIERRGEHLVVHVAEAPVLSKVAFEGNKKIQDKLAQRP